MISITVICTSRVPFVLMGLLLITTAHYGQCKQRVRASPCSEGLQVLLDMGLRGRHTT